VNFVNCYEWKGSKNQLTGALDASWTASVRKVVKRVDTSHYIQCNASGRLRPIGGNIVLDSLKIVGRVGRPPNAHQAR
jgi:hypothetical protein